MDKQWQSFNVHIFVATDVIQQTTSQRLLVAIMGIDEFMQKLILFDRRSLLLKQSDLFWRNGQAKLKTWLSWQSFCVSVS